MNPSHVTAVDGSEHHVRCNPIQKMSLVLNNDLFSHHSFH